VGVLCFGVSGEVVGGVGGESQAGKRSADLQGDPAFSGLIAGAVGLCFPALSEDGGEGVGKIGQKDTGDRSSSLFL